MKKFLTRAKKRILFIIFWTVLIVSFIFSAFLIILKANGYQLNYKNFKILKTGMIILNGYNINETIVINGKDLKRGLPLKISNLEPGRYEIIIKANNYQDWSKTVEVEAGMAVNNQNIILFLKEPKDRDAPSNITNQTLLTDSLKNNSDIKISSNEIFYQDNLVSRFSQNVLSTSLYPDGEHIIFQVQNEIRVIELDGGNNQLLFKINSNEPTIFSFENNGSAIIFLDGGQIKAKTIR